jgi:lipoyl(octanoyl) transferase
VRKMSDSPTMRSLSSRWLGQVSYDEGTEAQNHMMLECAEPECYGGVVGLEVNRPIITLGKNADPRFLPTDRSLLVGVDVIQTDRGGQATAHMPGQLIIYPTIPMSKWRLQVRPYVEMLETTMIELLLQCGVRSHRDPQYPGIWIGDAKICAIGIRIRERIATHGLALNISNDLSLFRSFVPCGILDRGVTRLADHTESILEMEELHERFRRILQYQLGQI